MSHGAGIGLAARIELGETVRALPRTNQKEVCDECLHGVPSGP